MRALITVLDDITETSMPFNEFVLYRANHYFDEKQILIVCGSERALPKVTIPASLEIVYAGRKLSRIRRTVRSTVAELDKQGIPFVIHCHQVQSGFLAEMALLGTGLRKKTLFTVHSTFSGYKFHNKILSFVNSLLAQRTTCVSNASFRDYPGLIKRIKGTRIRALQNGVDTERIDGILAQSHRTEHRCSEFIYIARLIPLKNHVFLIDVLKRCDERIRFTFVGAEDADQTVRKKAEAEGVIDRIDFTGLIPRNEVFRRLQSADYYISSSTLEGLPVSTLEAMYCGLPCVLSDIPQHREIGEEAAVLLPFDPDRWAAELERLASLSGTERKALSDKLRAYIKEHFALGKMHEQYDAIYESI